MISVDWVTDTGILTLRILLWRTLYFGFFSTHSEQWPHLVLKSQRFGKLKLNNSTNPLYLGLYTWSNFCWIDALLWDLQVEWTSWVSNTRGETWSPSKFSDRGAWSFREARVEFLGLWCWAVVSNGLSTDQSDWTFFQVAMFLRVNLLSLVFWFYLKFCKLSNTFDYNIFQP